MRQFFNHHVTGWALLLGLSAFMAVQSGCSTPRPQGDPPGKEITEQEIAPAGQEQDPSNPDMPIVTMPGKEPTGPLTMRQALALAQSQNPELAVFSWEVRMEESQILQAGMYPNPEVGLEVENLGGSGDYDGAREAETTLQFSQLVLMGDKRAKAVRAARLSRDLASWDYEIKRLEVLAETARAFIEVLSLQQQVALADQRVALAREVVGAVSQRVDQALNLTVEQTRAELALASAEIDRDQTGRSLESARFKLTTMWNNTQPQFERAAGDLDTTQEIPSLETLQERLRQNPDLARWATEISRRQANLRLEESRRIPDFTVSGGYRRLSGPDENVFVTGISVPLPLFNKNQGGIRQAEDHLAQAEDEQRAAELRLQTALSMQWQELSAATAEVSSIQDKLLARAQKTFDQINQYYKEGLVSYLEVLDAQRTFFAIRTQRLQALQRYHHALLALERLLGEPLQTETSPEAR